MRMLPSHDNSLKSVPSYFVTCLLKIAGNSSKISSQRTGCRTRDELRRHRSASTLFALASIHRVEFELGGLFKFHCVSLCGRLYPLPRRTTFRFRNALHLVEARNSVAYVRGIFQRLLALLRKRELGCGNPITSWLGQLCHYFGDNYLGSPTL